MRKRHTAAPIDVRESLSQPAALSAESTRRRIALMTRRNRNRLIDLGLTVLVLLACVSSAAVTLATHA